MSLKDSGQYYHEVLKRIPPRDLPAFEEESMQERVWGRRWGVYDDVGPAPDRPRPPSGRRDRDHDGRQVRPVDRGPDRRRRAVVLAGRPRARPRGDAGGARRAGRGALAARAPRSCTSAARRPTPRPCSRATTAWSSPAAPSSAAWARSGARPGMGRRGEEAHVSRVDRRDSACRSCGPSTAAGSSRAGASRCSTAPPRWRGCRSARTRRRRARSRRCSPSSASGSSACRWPATRSTSTASS